MEEENQPCGICKEDTIKCLQHPKYVCRKCLRIYPILNEKGLEVEFYNVSWIGGFTCKIKETNETSKEHICYINNVKCWADEYRYGGIMIKVIEKK